MESLVKELILLVSLTTFGFSQRSNFILFIFFLPRPVYILDFENIILLHPGVAKLQNTEMNMNLSR